MSRESEHVQAADVSASTTTGDRAGATVPAPFIAPALGDGAARLGPAHAVALQRGAGNQAVASLLAGQRSETVRVARTPRVAADPGISRALADCAVARRTAGVMREEEEESESDDLIPDWLMDGIRSAVSAIPGYTVLSAVVGKDPLTGEAVTMDRDELVSQILGYGPFAAAAGPALSAVQVLDDIFTLISEGLAAHNLTLARVEADIGRAWEEVSVLEGIDGNVAIVERYVNALLADVSAFVESIVDRVIELVREAAVAVAEPLLDTPEYELAKKVIHYDPLRGEAVDAPTVEILEDFLRLIGEEERLAQLQERGTLQQAADWLDEQAGTFGALFTQLQALFANAWEAIQPENLPDLVDNLHALAGDALALVRGVADFAQTVIAKALELVKASLLDWLSQYASDVPGFRLLTVVLGQNPFTGAAVERSAENLIGGFIALLPGGEQTYRQLAESGVISQAGQRIESELGRLGISVDLITSTFTGIWDSLTLDDLVDPIGAFERIVDQFGEPLSRLFEFVSVVIRVVVELILRLMNFPSDLLERIVANLMRSIEDIQRDPVGFLMNMLAALKAGFSSFFDNVLGYLTQGLTDWLFRGLGKLGIQAPTDLSPQSILDFVLQVLGVGVEALWEKLARHVGPERVEMLRGAVDRLTGVWTFIKDVEERGLAAIWDYVADQLGALWDSLVDMAKDWITTTIIERVTAKLLSMLDPTGIMAIVNSMVAFFNAVQSAIEYLRDILEIVDDYVTSFAEVAAGNIASGAAKVERGLANAIPVAIGFLANQVGISDVPEKIVELIERLRELVDAALDWLVEKAVSLGQSALGALGLGDGDEAPEDATAADAEADSLQSQPLRAGDEPHRIWLDVAGPQPRVMVASEPQDVEELFGRIQDELDEEDATTKQEVQAKLPAASAQTTKVEDSKAPEDLAALAGTMQEIIDVNSSRNVAVNKPAILAEYERLADRKIPAMMDLVLAAHAQSPTDARQRLVVLEADLRALMAQVPQGAQLNPAQRSEAESILREARVLARRDFRNVQRDLWAHLRADEELRKIEEKMAAEGDLGPGEKALQVKTIRKSGEGYGSLDIEHSARLSDQPFRYNARDNLMVTDAFQNQQYNEALRKHGGVWATDDIEAFVVFHQLNDQGIDFMPGRD